MRREFVLTFLLGLAAVPGLAQNRLNGKWATDRPADLNAVPVFQSTQNVLELNIEGAKASGALAMGGLGGTFLTFKDGKLNGNKLQFRTAPDKNPNAVTTWTVELVDENTVLLSHDIVQIYKSRAGGPTTGGPGAASRSSGGDQSRNHECLCQWHRSRLVQSSHTGSNSHCDRSSRPKSNDNHRRSRPIQFFRCPHRKLCNHGYTSGLQTGASQQSERRRWASPTGLHNGNQGANSVDVGFLQHAKPSVVPRSASREVGRHGTTCTGVATLVSCWWDVGTGMRGQSPICRLRPLAFRDAPSRRSINLPFHRIAVPLAEFLLT